MSLLYGEELQTTFDSPRNLKRRGYHDVISDISCDSIRFPSSGLKRYWDRNIWSHLFLRLLNGVSVSEPIDLVEIIEIFTEFCSNKKHIKKVWNQICEVVQTVVAIDRANTILI